jgi:hypothetical protein
VKSANRLAIGSDRKISGLTGAPYSFHKVDEFGRGMTGRVKIKVSKDRPGSVRPVASSKGKVLGTLALESDPVDGSIEVSFASGSALNLYELAKAEEAKRHDMICDAWDIIEERDGIGSTELRAALDGDNAKKGPAISFPVDNGYASVEKVGKAHRHHIVKALPAVLPSQLGPPPSDDDEDDDEDD